MAIDANPSLRGSAVGLFLFDVCEEMKLDEVRSILGARRLGEGLKHAAAEQLFFERPPVVEEAQLPGDAKAQVRVKYYDYGVVSVLFEFPFAGEWPDLISFRLDGFPEQTFPAARSRSLRRKWLALNPR